MNPVRVMHVVVAGDIGGAERLLVDLATRPEQSGAIHEIALFTPNPALRTLFVDANIVVHDRGPARENPFSYLARTLGPTDVAWLARLFASRRTDVAQTHTFASHVLGTRAALSAHLPQIRTEHHVMHYFMASCAPFTRWAARRTTRLVAVSEYVRDVIVKTAPYTKKKIGVARNGIDANHWSPQSRSIANSSVFRVAVICRLTAWKRVHLAIEAAAIANVELTIVGDGEERKKLEALANEKNAKVTFVGQQGDPRPFIAASDVTLSAAEKEPLGLSVLESLSMERPVIACAEGGIVEIVRDGETGFLVENPSAKSIAAALDRARSLRDRLPAMGEAARKFVVREGSVDRMCRLYAEEYRMICGRS